MLYSVYNSSCTTNMNSMTFHCYISTRLMMAIYSTLMCQCKIQFQILLLRSLLIDQGGQHNKSGRLAATLRESLLTVYNYPMFN